MRTHIFPVTRTLKVAPTKRLAEKHNTASRKYAIVNTRKYRIILWLTYKLHDNAADITVRVRESSEKQVKRRNMPLFQLMPCVRREHEA